MELGLAGRVAIVTGSSAGIGRAIAIDFAREGAGVVLCARGRDQLHATAKHLEALGAGVEPVVADVGTPAGAETVIEAAHKRFGRLDILVNNAAGAGGRAGFEALSDADWGRAIEQTLMSAVWCSRAAVPHMRQHNGGSIVNIASTSGREPDVVVPHYNVAKAGLINLSKTLANAFASEHIRVNCVCPGLTRTPAVERSAVERLRERGERTDGLSPADAVARYFGGRRPIPLGRVGEPEDISGAVVFLCSERASWITGACLDVDGGWVKAML